ncbi:recombinase family protein [Nocardia pseudobrasiliensis]|uniref:recombinase family protein n=1 Tax=Nocardia pseudobrasiliensis TaxID=45979 RepID=UPI000E0C555B|nr:recombinase family protein [Nocardia pseudobrasiliensis]
MPNESDEWAVLDEMLGIEVDDEEFDPNRLFAFVGRVSTEDHQDPETSYNWQLARATAVAPGEIVGTYFDIGHSRSVPWDRRPEAARLLADLKNPKRRWRAIVVGEGQRCWYGNQFSLVAPRLNAYGVEIWIPELGGRFDPQNTAHNMMMNMLGGMSQSERQHVQQRTRAAMDAQVLNEGRHQGGRAPYGYTAVDGAPHPNPSRAAAGLKLRILVIDEQAAAVVQRIFRAYIAGTGLKAIANMLNHEGIPCPSAHRPEQNTHRSGDGWQMTTVAAILDNPRYTGYAVFGRATKHEELVDPDDVAAGHIVRFRRSSPDRIIRSRRPAHPSIVSVATFTEAQLVRRRRAASGNRARTRLERTRLNTGPRVYELRGRIRCDICDRKMQGETPNGGVYYRCVARTLPPGSPMHADHPKTVNLREAHLTLPLNAWIAERFNPSHRAQTIEALVAAQADEDNDIRRQILRRRFNEAEAKLDRHRTALEAGVDPAVLVDAINAAQAEKTAAQAELDRMPQIVRLSALEFEKLIDSYGDIAAVLDAGTPHDRAALYAALNLEIRYRPREQLATVSVCVVNTGVRRGT